MRQKIASVFVVAFCLFLILLVLFSQSISIGVGIFMVIAAFGMLAAVYQYTTKRSGIEKLTTSEGQKVIDDNIDWLKKRWDRIQEEKDSGLLRTVERWYFDEATESQLSRIKSIGLNLGTVKITKGSASDIIGLYEPPEKKHIGILKWHNIPIERMNETKARELVATLKKKHKQTQGDENHPTENLIIRQLSDDFIYFARFFDSRIRYNDTLPRYVPKDYQYWIRYKQALQLGLARKGSEIPLEEKLMTLKLDQLSSLAGDQKFTKIAPAIEYLMDVPDIVGRFESMAPIDDWYQLKRVKLDMKYLEARWSELHGDDY
jgi:hypothetical protein